VRGDAGLIVRPPRPPPTRHVSGRRRGRREGGQPKAGWNVSHITAYSWVSVIPNDFSARAGLRECGRPVGGSVRLPTSIPWRDEKVPVDVIDHYSLWRFDVV